MGAWHEGIYGNDLAQDFLCHLLDCYKTSTRKPRGLAPWMNRKNKYEKR